MDPDNKLQSCKEARNITTAALARSLRKALSKNKVSEKEFRDIWLEELRKSQKIFSNGWYIPPPNGLIVLFATAKDPKRVLYPSMRPKETWPRDNVYLDKTNGIMAFYASPVNKISGIIGDTEVMIYLGKDKDVIKTLKACIEINREIFNFVRIGQKFSDVAKFANNLIIRKGFVNNILSTTDPHIINIGHTIPATYEDWAGKELRTLKSGEKEWVNVCQLISSRRVFLNETEDFEIQAPMAFTIEPRLRLKNRLSLPSAWSHSITIFRRNGTKELLFDFEEVYRVCGVRYLT